MSFKVQKIEIRDRLNTFFSTIFVNPMYHSQCFDDSTSINIKTIEIEHPKMQLHRCPPPPSPITNDTWKGNPVTNFDKAHHRYCAIELMS